MPIAARRFALATWASPIPVPAGIVEVFERTIERTGLRLGPDQRQDACAWES
jgi:hypothetical protein